MKNVMMLAVACTLLFAGCSGQERKAQAYLDKAEEAFSASRFNEAKLLIDSVKELYPKAFKARRAGIGLMQQVELKEQEVNLAYLDSVLQVCEARFDSLKGQFVLEKDTAYQEIGNWFYPSQTVEKNIGRSFLRGQVSEKGEMVLTSIYCGGRNIHHTAVKVSVNDLFAETPMSNDIYESSDLGTQIEKADYKRGSDGGVIDFVAMYSKENIKLEYVGERPYSVSMPVQDRKAIACLLELSNVLTEKEQVLASQKEANQKIAFVKKRMSQRQAEAQ